MTRATNKLTATAVRNAKPKEKAYKLSDGGGMYLEITPQRWHLLAVEISLQR